MQASVYENSECAAEETNEDETYGIATSSSSEIPVRSVEFHNSSLSDSRLNQLESVDFQRSKFT